MQDRRIAEIAGLIDSGRYDLLSLDIFDTLVWRMTPAPPDVFILTGRRLRDSGHLYPSSSPESFARERSGAEERARRRQPSHEVTLEEIYDEFPAGYLRGMSPREALEVELDVERSVIRVNPDMAALVDRARARGMRVALVSDTYFSGDQLRELTGVDPDFMLVSCEERLSKYLGLHGRLVERSGVAPGRILHVGNDEKADVEGPAVFGIERYWYRMWPAEYENMLALESPATLSGRAALITADDGGLTAMRSRAMFATDGPYERWGAGVMGPVVAGFAEWVDTRCREEGIDVALCLMREGRVLTQVLETIDAEVAAREFFVSRYSARKAAIFEATETELADFVLRPTPQRRSRVFEQLGLPADAMGDAAEDPLLSPQEARGFLKKLRADGALRKRIVADSARARAALIAHLRAVLDGARPARVALVDLGYRGTIQECLERIFRHEGLGIRTHGLYLVTGGEVHVTQSTGAPAEGWLAENGQPIAMAHTFMRSPEIFEQGLMASCGTTNGHEDDGTPVLDAMRLPAEQVAQIEAVQRGLLTFAAAWREVRDLRAADGRDLRPLFQSICIRSVARPLPIELELFAGWVHDENFGTAVARGICAVEGLDAWEQGHISAHQLASLPMSRLHWPFGYARRMSPAMGEAVTGIFLRAAEPEAFDSGFPEQVMAVYWDTGRGFNRDEAAIETFRLNNRGTAWQRFTLHMDRPGQRPRRVAMSLGLRDEIVRLTGVTVRARAGQGGESVTRIPHEALEKHGYEHVHRDLYVVREDPALLVVPLDEVPVGTREVDVDLFFGLVPEVAPGASMECALEPEEHADVRCA